MSRAKKMSEPDVFVTKGASLHQGLHEKNCKIILLPVPSEVKGQYPVMFSDIAQFISKSQSEGGKVRPSFEPCFR